MNGRMLRVTPGGQVRSAARAGVFVGIAFAIVGVVFGAVVLTETDEIGPRIAAAAFFTLFVVASLSIAVRSGRIASGRGGPAATSLLDVEVEPGVPGDASAPPSGDFADRLRKLEALRADGLVTEDEYREKRSQILGERW